MNTATAKTSSLPLDEWDFQIRHGQGLEVGEHIRLLNLAKVPRAEAAKLAWLAWRSGHAEVSSRLLHPIVRADRPLEKTPTPEEVAEYGVTLVRLGAIGEAVKLLEAIDEKQCPKALLYRAFAHATRWDYVTVGDLLRRYLAVAKDPYDKLVAQTNLAMALVYERNYRESGPLLSRLLHDTSVRKYRLLLGVTLEARAADLIQQKKFAQAEEYLKYASDNLATTGNLDEFFLSKWKAVLALRRNPSAESIRLVKQIQERATAQEHWETVRDCDRHLAIATHDEKLLTHLYSGTPFDLFREKLLEDFGEAKVPSRHVWKFGEGSNPSLLDLRESNKELKPAQLTWRILVALSADFYRAFRPATLHEAAFPGEFYNAFTSAQRVRVAIERTRKWLKASDVSITIEESRGFYRLFSTTPAEIHLAETAPVDAFDLAIATIKKTWPTEPFSSSEIGEIMPMSPRSLSRILSLACDDGVLTKSGKGKKTRYQLSKG